MGRKGCKGCAHEAINRGCRSWGATSGSFGQRGAAKKSASGSQYNGGGWGGGKKILFMTINNNINI